MICDKTVVFCDQRRI